MSIKVPRSLIMGSWDKQVRKFLSEEEEEDYELLFVHVPAIILYLAEEKMHVHTSSLPGTEKVKEIMEGHSSWCRVEFRVGLSIIVQETIFCKPFSSSYYHGLS